MTHKPAPWLELHDTYDGLTIETANGEEQASSYDFDFIVKAVNSHEQMLAALKRCYEVFRMDEVDTAISMQVGMAISAAEKGAA